jgi:hypothetical protein
MATDATAANSALNCGTTGNKHHIFNVKNTIMTEIKCWSCDKKTEIVRGADGINQFSICTRCNPAKTIETIIQGCEAICEVCKAAVPYDPDYVVTCAQCGKFICDSCEPEHYIDGATEENIHYCSEGCYEKLMYRHRRPSKNTQKTDEQTMQLD